MRTEIKQLLDAIDSDAEQYDAGIQLGFILEISNGHSVDPYHHDELTEEQLKIRLTGDEQPAIVRELLRLIESKHPQSGSLIFITGKAAADVIISLFQDFFLNNYAQMDNELIYQSIIALQNGYATQNKNILSKLKFAELKTMFEVLTPSSDERISKHTQYCLAHLKQIQEEIDD